MGVRIQLASLHFAKYKYDTVNCKSDGRKVCVVQYFIVTACYRHTATSSGVGKTAPLGCKSTV
ncbi:MAG: hypothetical protein ABI325_05185 [Ginsengibacter sp.]